MGSCPGVRHDGRVGACSLQPGSDTHDGPDVGRYYESRDPGRDYGGNYGGNYGAGDTGRDYRGNYDAGDSGRHH